MASSRMVILPARESKKLPGRVQDGAALFLGMVGVPERLQLPSAVFSGMYCFVVSRNTVQRSMTIER
jgi:hypothetical protein